LQQRKKAKFHELRKGQGAELILTSLNSLPCTPAQTAVASKSRAMQLTHFRFCFFTVASTLVVFEEEAVESCSEKKKKKSWLIRV
jgi:hypothetical protein